MIAVVSLHVLVALIEQYFHPLDRFVFNSLHILRQSKSHSKHRSKCYELYAAEMKLPLFNNLS